MGKHIVLSGEGLWSIAKKNNMTLEELLELNGLTAKSIIHPGQELVTSKGDTPTLKPRQSSSESIHSVVSGDSLSEIAKKYGMSLDELLKMNNISKDKALFGVDNNPDPSKRRNYSITAIAEAVPRDAAYMYRDKDGQYTAPGEKPKLVAKKESEKPKSWWKIFQKGGVLNQETDGEMSYTLPLVTVTNFKDRPDLGWQANRFIDGLNGSRQYMMRKYGWTDEDFTNYSKIALNLANQESDYGRGKRYIAKAIVPDAHINKAKRLKGMWNWAVNDGKFPWKISASSKGLTQIKYGDDIENDALKQDYRDLGIYSEEQLMDPKTSAEATLVRLHHNNQALKGRTIRYSDNTEIPFAEQHGFMWNAGRLTDKANENIQNPDVTGYSRYVRNYMNNADYK